MESTHQKNLLKKAIIDCLSGNAIFTDLDSTELNIVSEHMHVSRFEPGDIVFAEGDPGDEVCFMVDGILDVLKIKSGEVEKKIAIKAPGGSIGEMAVIGGFSRTATVKAHTDVTLLTLSRRRFDQICNEYPVIGVKILRSIARMLSLHLRDTSQELLEVLPH
ncbi:cyclic nucleotide-binding domain-containing protein [uncultured Desulfosarcina sp.]|uniref:cyclic nucleotide-binding domain-containing protein n=1 Tax=uncultured Desulfosarcina sp. TaxID=218289 RepID=UPI0029C88DAA|nr:cyclic nucleotide-binding domain-containing protein [uncultured Desulfosarcina sp.]